MLETKNSKRQKTRKEMEVNRSVRQKDIGNKEQQKAEDEEGNGGE